MTTRGPNAIEGTGRLSSQKARIHRRQMTIAAGIAGALIASATLVAGALASYPPYINLTTAGAQKVDASGAVFIQGGTGAGTGTFDPFLTLSPGGSTDTEKGYNTTDASGEFDTFFGGGRTHPVSAAAIPPLTFTPTGGSPGLYREFSLDANDQGADDWMSIDAIKIFLDDQNDLSDYNIAGETFGTDTAPAATKIYDMGAGNHVLMRSQTLTPGSGVSDITVLIPDSLFPANCFYGSTTCNKWLYFYTESGFLGISNADGETTTQNYNVTSGFEEWRTRLLPVVNVTKTAVPSATRTFDWTLVKEISIDGGTTWQDAATANLFLGQSQDYLWRLTWTKSAGTLSNAQVTGTITIHNPTGPGEVIAKPIDAVINSVTDVLTLGAVTTNPAVSCGVTFPHTLDAGDDLVCTYTATGVNADNGTNRADVVVENGTNDLTYSSPPVTIDWLTASINDVDESSSINDPNFPGANQSNLATSGSFTSTTQTYTCGSTTTITNTATLTEIDSGQTRTDSASITVNCHSLTVAKSASTSFIRTFDWTLVKEISINGGTTWQDAASVSLFGGQSQNYLWRLTWTKNAGTDSDWAVNGTITVTNPAPFVAAGVVVTDMLSVSGAAPVTCPSGNIAANGGTLVCTYSLGIGAATNQTNTATATLFGHGYNSSAVAVTFSSTPTTEVDESASIDDPLVPGLNQTGLTASGSFTSTTQTYTCGSDTTITNTATLTEGDSSQARPDSASLTVDCVGLDVSKTVSTSLTRTYSWTILKSSTSPTALTLNLGETYVYPYSVTVNLAGAPVDSNWAVNGTITVTNNTPLAATGVSVTDVLSLSGAVAVNCPSSNIAANGGTLVCTYGTSVASGADQANTATATLAGQNYPSSAVPVSFASATVTKVDDCINVTDSVHGALGTACVGVDTLPKTFTYDETFGPFDSTQCGDHTFPNTATFVTDDTAATGSSSWSVLVTVPCPTGCTLTQGYWKTHSSYGPAPEDPTWTSGSFGPDTPFFLSGKTYYGVMWTSPKGGNAYYILAHQYIAALLNIEAGAATTPAVDAAITFATNFFSAHSPSDNLSKTDRAAVIGAASTLASYNEGSIGPGHCSEDSIATAANHD